MKKTSFSENDEDLEQATTSDGSAMVRAPGEVEAVAPEVRDLPATEEERRDERRDQHHLDEVATS